MRPSSQPLLRIRGGAPGFFQAFLASSAEHPVLARALQKHKKFYAVQSMLVSCDAESGPQCLEVSTNPTKIAQATRDFLEYEQLRSIPNLGTVLLLQSFCEEFGIEADHCVNLPPEIRHSESHVSVLFKEVSLQSMDAAAAVESSLQGSQGLAAFESDSDSGDDCDFVVLDARNSILLFSRVIGTLGPCLINI